MYLSTQQQKKKDVCAVEVISPELVCVHICLWISLELVLLYESAAVHIQDPKDVFDALGRHGSEAHQFKELLWIKGFT